MAEQVGDLGPRPGAKTEARAALREHLLKHGDGRRTWWHYVRQCCLMKTAYPTEPEAEAERLQVVHTNDDGLGDGKTYPCTLCDMWHWGRHGPVAEFPAAVHASMRAIVLGRRGGRPGRVPHELQRFRPRAAGEP